jgi:hypothetical protein
MQIWLASSLQANTGQTSEDLILTPVRRSQRLTSNSKRPQTASHVSTALQRVFNRLCTVCVPCVCCAYVASVVPSTVLTNILPVRKHQFTTVMLGSWPNGGTWEGVICVRYTDRLPESELHTVYVAAAGRAARKSERHAVLNSAYIHAAFHRHNWKLAYFALNICTRNITCTCCFDVIHNDRRETDKEGCDHRTALVWLNEGSDGWRT